MSNADVSVISLFTGVCLWLYPFFQGDPLKSEGNTFNQHKMLHYNKQREKITVNRV